MATVTSLDIARWSIVNLSGIEYFTSLTKLECSGNKLTALDISQNTTLTELNKSAIIGLDESRTKIIF